MVPEPDGSPRPVLVVAVLVPAAGLLTVAVRVLGGELGTGSNAPLDLLATGAGVVVLAVAGMVVIGRGLAPRAAPVLGRVGVVVFGVLAAAPVLVAATVWRDWTPLGGADAAQGLGSFLGPFALLIVGLAGLAAISGLVRLLVLRHDQLPVFTYLGFRRTPVIGIVLVVLALVIVAGAPLERADATSHDVPTVARTAGVRPCTDARLGEQSESELGQHLCRWIDEVEQFRDADDDSALPLVLVTASGGGVRAASWTTRVLDCLAFEDTGAGGEDCPGGLAREDRWPYVFAIGGASGGSVGAATATAQALAPLDEDEHGRGWAFRVGAGDHLAPVIGQMVVAELGLAWTGVVPEQDRAEVLIEEWRAPFGEVEHCGPEADDDEFSGSVAALGFLTAAELCPRQVPLLLFNGTTVRTGRRFDISPLDRPGSFGLRDVLCETGPASDVPLFDAAFLSARFPLVTPSGRLGGADCPDEGSRKATDVVDGGYRENSGAAQIAELWNDLDPLIEAFNDDEARPDIEPILVQIQNGPVDADPPEGDDRPVSMGCIVPAQADPGPVATDDARDPVADPKINIGEPARIPWAKLPTLLDEDHGDDQVANRLVEAFCDAGHRVLTFGLYDHPGRALPLGWSLTDGVLTDLEEVMALSPNACRAEVFARLVDDPASTPRRCMPCWKSNSSSGGGDICRDETGRRRP